ncbi:MAG: helix-turn-helix domain-containing protein [Sphaerochaeta sp.]
MSTIKSEVLTLQECSRYLKIAESTIYVLARNGRIPAQKVGRNWRFSKKALDKWLAGEITLPEPEAKQTEQN